MLVGVVVHTVLIGMLLVGVVVYDGMVAPVLISSTIGLAHKSRILPPATLEEEEECAGREVTTGKRVVVKF